MLKIDEEQFKKISEDFYTLTGLKIVLYDSNQKIICSTHKHTPLCRLLREKDELAKKMPRMR